MNLSYLTWLDLDSAGQQSGQYLGAHLPVRTPALPARWIVIFRMPGPVIHQHSGSEGVPDALLGVGQIPCNNHAKHHAPQDDQRQPFLHTASPGPPRAGLAVD